MRSKTPAVSRNQNISPIDKRPSQTRDYSRFMNNHQKIENIIYEKNVPISERFSQMQPIVSPKFPFNQTSVLNSNRPATEMQQYLDDELVNYSYNNSKMKSNNPASKNYEKIIAEKEYQINQKHDEKQSKI